MKMLSLEYPHLAGHVSHLASFANLSPEPQLGPSEAESLML